MSNFLLAAGRMRMLLIGLAFATGLFAQPDWPRLNLQPDASWPKLPDGWNTMETAGVAVDGRGHVFVIHRGAHPVIEFDKTGRYVKSFGDGLFTRVHAIRADHEGNLWAVDDGGHVVLKMSPQGRVLMVFGRFLRNSESKGTQDETDGARASGMLGMRDEKVLRFNRPTDVAIAANGDVYVADGYGNSRVVKFDRNGRFIRMWGTKGGGPGQFNTPHSILVDRQGRVYVADRENYRIQVFDGDGKFLHEWKHVGSPWGLALTADNHIIMSDGYNGRILKLDLNGKVLGSFGQTGRLPGEFQYPHQVAAAPDGTIYAAEILNWRAQKLSPR